MRESRRAGISPEAGFSLVEVLVAIFLFALAMVPLTGVFVSSARSIGDQRLRTAATRLATDRLETLRSLPFDQLDAEAGERTVTTPDGRQYAVATEVTAIDPATDAPSVGGGVKRVTVTVRWRSAGSDRRVSYTTAIARDDRGPVAAARSIVNVTMFPNPSVTDGSGQPLEDVQATVTLRGFDRAELVRLSWSNADGTAGAKTLTSVGGVNWVGTIPANQVRAALNPEGRGELEFTVSAGSLTTVAGLPLQRAVQVPPAITAATIDRNPISVAAPAPRQSCDDRNQCLNTTDVTFTVAVAGLDPAQDSVILQFQLVDGSFQELPLAPSGERWSVIVRQGTTKFRPGLNRVFRFSALRSSDGGTAAATVEREVREVDRA